MNGSANVQKIELNHSVIAEMMLSNETIKQIVEDTAADVEAQMGTASDRSHARWMAEHPGDYVPSSTVTKSTKLTSDRYRARVGIDPAHTSDFVYGTIESAIEAAGGVKRGEQ